MSEQHAEIIRLNNYLCERWMIDPENCQISAFYGTPKFPKVSYHIQLIRIHSI